MFICMFEGGSCLQKALFMALRFSGRWSSTCVMDSAGRLMARVV